MLNPKITSFTENIKKLLYKQISTHKIHQNLTILERQAISNLQQNSQIVIKKADKSAGIAIMNTVYYENKINAMLSDTKVYTRTDIDDTVHVKAQSDTIIQSLFKAKYINSKQLQNMTKYSPTCPVFYGIPKIHKQGIPLRPIVSQTNGPTCKISKYLDYLLSTAESQIPLLLKDTTSFLQLIEQNPTVPSNTILVTLDVVSLYTNIPHNEGAKFVTELYEDTLEYWNCSLTSIPSTLVYQLIMFILQNTTFEFNQHYYTQNYGTTMGSSFSVKFANIFMYKHLTSFDSQSNIKFPNFTARLVDDIFMLWQDTEEKLLEFVHTLNNFHSTIKFELNYSLKEVNFLDTIVYIDHTDNSLHTKLFIKPTHKNQYLHFTSEHPIHVKKSIPFSQALRLRRIIDNEEILSVEIKALKNKFLQRGYPEKILSKELNKITPITRTNTLIYKTDEIKKANFQKFLQGNLFLPFTVSYSNTFKETPTFYDQFHTMWNEFLSYNPEIAQIFQNTTPKIIYTRGKTLQQYLVKSKFSLHPTNNFSTTTTTIDLNSHSYPKITKCSSPKCLCCHYIQVTSVFHSTQTHEEFHINSYMNCNSHNIIYLITCNKCKIQYIGQTGRQLKQRLTDHRSNINLQKNTPISIHFNSPLHSLKDLNIIPIELLTSNDIQKRLEAEKSWINKLFTKYPNGLNYYPILHTTSISDT